MTWPLCRYPSLSWPYLHKEERSVTSASTTKALENNASNLKEEECRLEPSVRYFLVGLCVIQVLFLLGRDVLQQTEDFGLIVASNCKHELVTRKTSDMTRAVHSPALP